jgi:hypothetical protein
MALLLALMAWMAPPQVEITGARGVDLDNSTGPGQ